MHSESTTVEMVERPSLPAWLMSLVLHMLLLILLALGVRTAARSASEEPRRRVGIVLAQRDDEERFAYLDDTTDSSEQAQEDVERSTTTPERVNPGDAEGSARGPSQPSSLLIPEIRLPGVDSPVGTPDDVLAHSLDLHRGGRQPILPGLDDEAILAEDAAARAARNALGPPTEVSIFGSASAQGRSFVFAIDRSKSMGGSGLNALLAARGQLSRALERLSPQHQFQIVAYHHKCVYYKTTRLIPATEENKSGVADFIDSLASFGGTGHEMAVRAGVAMEPDVVFLLTDGGEPSLNEIQLAGIHKLASGRTTIHCIQFGFGPLSDGDNFLMQVARQNGGGYTYVNMSQRRGQ